MEILEVIEAERDEGAAVDAPTASEFEARCRTYLDGGGRAREQLLVYAAEAEAEGLPELALECLTRALGGGDPDGRMFAGRGRICSSLFIASVIACEPRAELIAGACADLEMARRLVPGDSSILREYVTSLLLAGRHAECRMFIEGAGVSAGTGVASGEEADLLYLLGFAELFDGRSEAAERCFGVLARGEGYAASGHFGLGVCLLLAGEVVAFEETCRLLGDLDGRLSEALRGMGPRGVSGFDGVAAAYFGA